MYDSDNDQANLDMVLDNLNVDDEQLVNDDDNTNVMDYSCDNDSDESDVEEQSEALSIAPKQRHAWTTAQDVQMCKSWVAVSERPIEGNSVKSSAFWKCVLSDFKAAGDQAWPERTEKSLKDHWRVVSALVSKFCGVVAAIERRKASGKVAADEVRIMIRFVLKILESRANIFINRWVIASSFLSESIRFDSNTSRAFRSLMVPPSGKAS